MSFAKKLTQESRMTRTEWGELVLTDLENPFLDISNMGQRLKAGEFEKLRGFVEQAWNENPETCLKYLFHFYDIRNGKGLRDHFRVFVKFLLENYPETLQKNLAHIPFYGRWDMLEEIYGATNNPSLRHEILELINQTLDLDDFSVEVPEHAVSLLAKWLPSHNVKSKTKSFWGPQVSRKNFVRELVRGRYGVHNQRNEKKYRNLVSKLRKRIGIVETLMSQNRWDEVDFATLPGVALYKYSAAWHTHLQTEWETYLNKASKGQERMNATTVDFIQIFDMAYVKDRKALADALWENRNKAKTTQTWLPIIDTSGSMFVDNALATAVTVGLHAAQQNKGEFAGVIGAFSTDASFFSVKGLTFSQALTKIKRSNWNTTTNLNRAFSNFLSTAQKHLRSGGKLEDVPQGIIILSDMEVSMGTRGLRDNTVGNLVDDLVVEMFKNAAVPLPTICWWNCRNNRKFAGEERDGVLYLSGSSPSAIPYMMYRQSPMDQVLATVNDERYDRLEV